MRKKITSIFQDSKPNAAELEARIKELLDRQRQIDDKLLELDESLAVNTAIGDNTESILNEISRLDSLARNLPRSIELLKKEYREVLFSEAENELRQAGDKAKDAVVKLSPLYEKIQDAIDRFHREVENLSLDDLPAHRDSATAMLRIKVNSPIERFSIDVEAGIADKRVSIGSNVNKRVAALDTYSPSPEKELTGAAV